MTTLINSGYLPEDNEAERRKKAALMLVPMIIGPAAFIWGSIYFYLERYLSGSIPMSYAVISLFSLVYFFRTHRTGFLENSQLILVLVLPFLLMWSQGGFFYGSSVMLWALFTPIATSIFMEKARAALWFVAYLVLLIISGLLQPYLSAHIEPIPEVARNIFFLLNLGGCSAGLYLLTGYTNSQEKMAIASLHQQQGELEAQKEELRISNQRLSEARLTAEAANKSKSEFLANMSHEIRTPMNAILGMTHLALNSNLDEKQKNYISKAYKSAEGLLGILNDILDFSKIEADRLDMEMIDFKLQDIISELRTVVDWKAKEKGIRVSYEVGSDVPEFLLGDPLRLKQVLLNLLSNAVKFCRRGDSVSLNVSLEYGNNDKKHLLFSVQDTGIGMSPEQKEQLFQAFRQGDNSITRSHGGTGLGLVISRKIVEMMGGAIWAESEVDRGTVFYFTASFAVSSLNDSSAIASADKSGLPDEVTIARALDVLSSAKVLIVEDNEINRELTVELLSSHGVDVKCAYDGSEALEMLADQHFDMVLMDCQMPIMDGFTATMKIREQESFKDLPVIALTANVMVEDVKKIYAAGMNNYLGKPINADRMFVTMANCLAPGQGQI